MTKDEEAEIALQLADADCLFTVFNKEGKSEWLLIANDVFDYACSETIRVPDDVSLSFIKEINDTYGFNGYLALLSIIQSEKPITPLVTAEFERVLPLVKELYDGRENIVVEGFNDLTLYLDIMSIFWLKSANVIDFCICEDPEKPTLDERWELKKLSNGMHVDLLFVGSLLKGDFTAQELYQKKGRALFDWVVENRRPAPEFFKDFPITYPQENK